MSKVNSITFGYCSYYLVVRTLSITKSAKHYLRYTTSRERRHAGSFKCSLTQMYTNLEDAIEQKGE